MSVSVRDNVRLVAGVLSVVSLALVFSAVGGIVPNSLLPRFDPLVSSVPHVNAVISATAIVTILAGVRSIRRGNVDRHRTAMLTSTLLFASFLVFYLYRVSLEGPTTFTGPDWIRQFVYLPVLAIHILLAMVCIPLVYYALLLALTRPVSALPGTPHPRVGRLAAGLWLVSFSLGIVVWLLLHVIF